MLKLILLVVFAFFAVVTLENVEITEDDAVHILEFVKTELKKTQIECASIETSCYTFATAAIPPSICRVLLKAYICRNITTPEGIQKILSDFATEGE